jgi:hypothetical protein
LIDYRPGPRRVWLVAARRAVVAAALLWTALFLRAYYGSDLRVQHPETAFFRTHR